ncbi:Hypothetical predicted protein, partial [Paramuricea clavata]
MEQIRVELVDQNKVLSSKVEALELDLKTCKLNLHELEQRNTINYSNQQCGSITPKGDRSINSQIEPNNNTKVEAKINYANSHTFNQRKEINQETKRNNCELSLDQSCIVVEDQSTDINLSRSQQVSKQNEDRCGLPTIIFNTLHQIPQHDLTNQYSIPMRIT